MPPTAQRMIDEGDTGEGLDPWTVRHLPRLAELSARWADFAVGDTLAHCDLRADNMLLTADGRVVFVDWPHARGGPDPEETFTAHPLGRDADPDGVTATLAAFAGFLIGSSRRPPVPGIPTLRPFQRAQGEAASEWLRKRLG